MGGTTTGLIDGGGGVDTLDIDDVNLRNTTITGIENSILRETIASRTIDIDAAQVVNLGAVDVQNAADGVLDIDLYDFTDGIIIDFSNFTLSDGDAIDVRYAANAAGLNTTIDFSGATLSGTAPIRVSLLASGSNDTIIGTDEADVFDGSSGDDVISGRGGDDEINGSIGNDVIDGGAGNDTLTDLNDSAVIVGGTGDDTINARSSNGGISSIDGGADNDTINLISGSYSGNAIDGGSGDDTLNLNGINLVGTTITGIEETILTESFASSSVRLDLSEVPNLGNVSATGLVDGIAALVLENVTDGASISFANWTLADDQSLDLSTSGSDVGETITLDFSGVAVSGAPAVNVSGGAFRVDYAGGNANEVLTGTADADLFSSIGGDDVINGGAGDDVINSGSGDDVVNGGDGDDTITDFSNSGVLNGNDGNDIISARSSGVIASSIDGGADDDQINLIDGSYRDNTVDGGAGNDTLLLRNMNAAGTTFTGIEQTVLEETNVSTNVQLDVDQLGNLGTVTANLVGGGFLGVVVTNVEDGDAAGFSGWTLGDGESLDVSVFDGSGTETVTFDFSAITFLGSAATDGGGDPLRVDFQGGAANEIVTGSDERDLFNVSSGNDVVNAGGGDDVVNASSGNDTVNGGDGDDTIDGSSGDDVLNGGDGDDEITDTSGGALITGGEGDDTITARGSNAIFSSIDAGADDDQINLVDGSYRDNTVDGGAGNDTLLLRNIDAEGTTFTGIEQTVLEELNIFTSIQIDIDQLGNLGAVTTNLTADGFLGLQFTDVEDGDVAGFSSWTIGDGESLDIGVSEGISTETVTFDFSAITFLGSAATDTDGDPLRVDFQGGSANEIVTGSDERDLLRVSGGNDVVNAGGGDDEVSASAGNDTVNGGAGDDTISLGSGSDIVVASVDNGQDTITDFTNGSDLVDLRPLPRDAAILAFLTASDTGGGATELTFISGGSMTLQGQDFASEFDITDLILDDGVYALDDAFTVDEDTVLTGNVFAANQPSGFADLVVTGGLIDNDAVLAVDDFTVDGQTLTAGQTATLDSGATFTLNTDGSFTYDPRNGAVTQALSERLAEELLEEITYTASSGSATTDTGDIDITVTAVNDAPSVSGPVLASVNEDDAAIDVDLVANVVDVDNQSSFSIVTLPATLPAGASIVGNTLTVDPSVAAYQPLNDGETASVAFSYTIEDELGAQSTASVDVTINGVNDAPVASDDTASTDEDSSASSIDVVANDTDVDVEPLLVKEVNGEVILTSSPVALASGAIVSLNSDGTLAYDPNGAFEDLDDGESAEDSFAYTVSDGDELDPATVTVTVNGINDAPVADDDTASTDENSATTPIDVLDGDTDVEGDSLSVTAVEGQAISVGGPVALASGAIVSLNANGTLTYDPNGAFESLDDGESTDNNFVYTVSDGDDTDEGSVAVTVDGVNDAPVAVDDAASTDEDFISGPIGVLSNDTDVDGDALSVSAVDGQAISTTNPVTLASGAVVSLNANGTLAYDPNGAFEDLDDGESTTDTFAYTATDGDETDAATVTMTITGVNDAPVAVDDGAGTVKDDTADIDVLANDTDVDGDLLSVSEVNGQAISTTSPVTLASGAIVSLNADGTLGYDPNGQFGTLSSNDTATDTFSYTVTDGDDGDTGDVTVTITGSNVPPVALDDAASTDEDTPIASIDAAANDTDGDLDPLTVTQVNGQAISTTSPVALASGAVVSLNADGTLGYDPNGAFEGFDDGDSTADAFNYTVTDGTSTDDAEIIVTVNGVNDAPVAADDTGATSKDGTTIIDVADNDTDADGDPLLVTQVNGQAISTTSPVALASGAIVSLNADGTLGYDPNGAFDALGSSASATDTFSYTIGDGNEADTGSVAVTITGSNVPPVAMDDAASTDENSAIATIDVLGNDTDADLDVLSVAEVEGQAISTTSPVVLASGAIVSLNADGTLGYDPNGAFEDLDDGESTTETFSYTVTDGTVSDDGEVTVTVGGVNDAPSADDDTALTDEDSAIASIDVLDGDSDADGDPLTITEVEGQAISTTNPVALASGAIVSLNADGTLGYDPNGALESLNTGEQTTDTFAYTVSDGDEAVAGSVTITIDGVDDGSSGVTIVVTAASEVLAGGAGDDTIITDGLGFDLLVGGDGADTFAYTPASGNGRQISTIDDYTPGEDVIDLAGVDVLMSFTAGSSLYLFLNNSDFDTLVVNGVTDLSDLTIV